MIQTYRPFQLIVEGRLVLQSPVHVGTGEAWNVFTDAPVVREANRPYAAPYLPGTSLKGVLWSHLEREAALIGCSQHHLDCLFGRIGPLKADHSQTVLARLTVFDAPPLQSERILAEVRDHVRLSRKTGAAEHGAKFDAEVVLPEQAEFHFRAVYEGNSEEDAELVLLYEGIQALESGELRVGAKSGWGYGRIHLQGTTYREYQRTKLDDLQRYLKDRLPSAAHQEGSSKRKWPELNASSKGELKLRHDPLCELSFGLSMQFEGPVLVKAPIPPLPPSTEADHAKNGDERNHPESYWKRGLFMADDVFVAARTLAEAKPYLPGSSLRGVLRARASQICASLPGLKKLDVRLFGEANESNGTGQKGMIEIGDGELQGAIHYVYLDHVAIDRITNAAGDGAKFSTCGLDAPAFAVNIRVRFPERETVCASLAAFLLRDLMQGQLWVGSGVTRGYGYLKQAAFDSISVNIPASWDWMTGVAGWQPESRPGRCLASRGKIGWNDLEWLWSKLDQAWRESRQNNISKDAIA